MNEPALNNVATADKRAVVRRGKWYSLIFWLRIEEFIALLFFGPMIYLTTKAFLFFEAQGHIPRRFVGDVQRAIIVVAVIIILILIAKYRPEWTLLRDGLPFGFCLAIYTNLHDTIHFANPHDIHDSLIAIDQWLFGVQPCVWTEQFIHPWLTEIFSFCYMLFFLWIPVVAVTLWFQGRRRECRNTLVSVILCFYIGYFLYVIFPAAPPRITLQHLFTVKFDGTPMADAAITMLNALPSDSRAAFPSLHSAVTLLALMFSWKYTRTLFWIILPFCAGLLLSTVYLRHHYVIDIIAGFALAIPMYIFGPRIDAWWQAKNPGVPLKS